MYAQETQDRALLRSLLGGDPVRAAYPLGDLDPAYFHFTRWFVASEDASTAPRALAMIYSGLRLPVLITYGEAHLLPAAVQLALQLVPGDVYAQIDRAHDAALAPFLEVNRLRTIERMGMRRDDFQPPARSDVVVAPLSHVDTGDLIQLYRFYPDAFFEPYQLESGHYFGIREGAALRSVAGIHVMSREFGVAVIGNVVTDPASRGRGYARLCVARQLEALFEEVPVVALNVPASNMHALRTFQSLGFKAHSTFLEGVCQARL